MLRTLILAAGLLAATPSLALAPFGSVPAPEPADRVAGLFADDATGCEYHLIVDHAVGAVLTPLGGCLREAGKRDVDFVTADLRVGLMSNPTTGCQRMIVLRNDVILAGTPRLERRDGRDVPVCG